MSSAVRIALFLVLGLATAGVIAADDQTKTAARSIDPFEDPALKPAMQRLESATDKFRDTLDDSLENSALDGTSLEDALNRWADFLEDEADNTAKDFGQKDGKQFDDHLENSMMAATAINRAMLRRGFSEQALSEWSQIRKDLNEVSIAFGRPVLPNLTVVTYVPATVETLSQAEVKQVMDELESSTDRFVDKFKKAWYTSIAAREQWEPFHQWTRDLESATDDLAEEYQQKDAPEYQFDLEHSLMIAAGLNRAMLASDTSKDAVLEWQTVRNHLNTLAKAFGYPVLPDRVERTHTSSR